MYFLNNIMFAFTSGNFIFAVRSRQNGIRLFEIFGYKPGYRPIVYDRGGKSGQLRAMHSVLSEAPGVKNRGETVPQKITASVHKCFCTGELIWPLQNLFFVRIQRVKLKM